jgi:hypothetical protein
MEKLLPQVERKIVLDNDLKGLLPLLPLDRTQKGGQP